MRLKGIQKFKRPQRQAPSFYNPQFSEEEDRLLLKMVLIEGPKFRKIIRLFPGKTFYALKNRYYKYIRYN